MNKKTIASILFLFVFILFSGCGSATRTDKLKTTDTASTDETNPEIPDVDSFWNHYGLFLEYMNKDEILSYEMKHGSKSGEESFVCRLMDTRMETVWEEEASADKEYIDSIVTSIYECEKSARKIKENEEINDITLPDESHLEKTSHDWTDDEHIILADLYYYYIIGKHEGKNYFEKHLVDGNKIIRENYLNDDLMDVFNGFAEFFGRKEKQECKTIDFLYDLKGGDSHGIF